METQTVTGDEVGAGQEGVQVDARSDEEKAADKTAEDTVNKVKPKKEKGAALKKHAAGRAASTMPGRRAQFRFAAEATKASSILAATWLEKPADETADGLALGLFYYRTPEKGEKHKVFQVRRKAGAVTTKLMGEGADAVETYRKFYSPLLKQVRGQQKEAAKQAKATAKKAAKPKAAKKATETAAVAAE